jgi:hypothetical protein
MSSSCAKSLLRCELAADDQPLNLGSAFVDLAVSEAALNLYWLKLPSGQAFSRTWTALVIEILRPRLESVLVEIAAALPSRFAARHGDRAMMHCENSLA